MILENEMHTGEKMGAKNRLGLQCGGLNNYNRVFGCNLLKYGV